MQTVLLIESGGTLSTGISSGQHSYSLPIANWTRSLIYFTITIIVRANDSLSTGERNEWEKNVAPLIEMSSHDSSVVANVTQISLIKIDKSLCVLCTLTVRGTFLTQFILSSRF